MMVSAQAGGLWDCHTHIYGPWKSFPLPDDAAYRPAEAPMTRLLEMHQGLGISHGVLVQAACYGTDHRALLAALAITEGRYRGVALIDGTADDATLQKMHDGGIRGIRFNFMGHLPGERNLDQLRVLVERIKPFGWHALLHGQLRQLLPVLDAWSDLDIPLVIDHMGREEATREPDESRLKELAKHLRHTKRWIKLSGVDRMMKGAPSAWTAAIPVARMLLAVAPERAIWGTDWPHPNVQGNVPDDACLLRFVHDVCGDDKTKEAVLVDNPRRLYF
ncbi:2-pyrone-4,6-dicarbaxylate hydrolase [Paraburkholderia domus]|uniref:amidohydrolase family protein n=1 Tax=Paraburkholderia domus TaxID=2793075 RepID=UPI001911E573|nr:amidohydrolase family protein [Paraburkholderia domus]MBK5085877.1 amidohydrolase family protein [Burkholderia sp. R-69927]CAE6840639.1 2-pyrone-4,6-dicarbaxylate hydrolase [Paraburkholderia domus]